jgi:hypothetical protein
MRPGTSGLSRGLDGPLPAPARLLQELPLAKGDGRSVKLMTALAKTDVLILDDWGLAPLSDDNRRDFLELLEDRHDCRATIVTSQLPVEHWHAAIGEPTLADAILDRLVHNAYKIALQGDSMRRRQAPCPDQLQRSKLPGPASRCSAGTEFVSASAA